MKQISLTKGYIAIVDDADYERLSALRWTAQERNTGDVHAARWFPGKRYVYMHHEILPRKEGFQVDHIDGNGLNNRRSNLRYVTKQQNQWNRRRTWGVSPYKGVYAMPKPGRWRAAIQHPTNKKQIHLGVFNTQEEAALAYDRAALTFFGQYAALNLSYKQTLPRAA